MNYGWLKLTALGHDMDYPDRGAVYVWAADTEMVRALNGGGCIVYLHHDKQFVCEEAEWVVEQIDEIRTKMGHYSNDQ